MSVYNAYMKLHGAIDAEVLRDARLSRRTTYRVGGPAALLVTCNTYRALVRCLEVLADEDVPWVVLGKGSNVLASDDGYAGCVVVLGREFQRSAVEGTRVTAGAGVALSKLVNDMLSRELSGLEGCVGIPGTLGGALRMNAGTRLEWIGSLVRDLVVLREHEGLVRLSASDVAWGYRSTSIPESDIVLEATLELTPGHKAEMSANMERRLMRRRVTQPLGSPSCGSVFKNPDDGRAVGRLIEECGLKGYRVGGAAVSHVHANFIVNEGDATASDVLAVMRHVRDTVGEAYGIDLQPEVRLLGFSS